MHNPNASPLGVQLGMEKQDAGEPALAETKAFASNLVIHG